MVAQKFTNFGKFSLMHADMTAVTVQSNKIVLNEVKRQLSTPGAIIQKKTKRTFWPTQ